MVPPKGRLIAEDQRLYMAGSQAALLQILLVIFLSRVERSGRFDLRHHFLLQAPALLQRFLAYFGGALLLSGMEEDGGAVLRAPIRPLPVQLSGVVVLPEDVEQRVIADLRGIISHFHDLSVAGRVSTDLTVSRVFR